MYAMEFYYKHFDEAYNSYKIIKNANKKSGEEIATILNYLQHKWAPWDWKYSAIVIICHRKDSKYEIIYEEIESETIDFMQKYFPLISLTEVQDINNWIKENIRVGNKK